MALLLNPHVAYLLMVVAVMLFLISAVSPQPARVKIAMTVCLVAAGLEFSQLGGNLWGILVVALSPLPFLAAIRLPRSRSFLALISIAMLAIGSVFIFMEDGQPYRIPFAGLVSLVCGRMIWILYLRAKDTQKLILRDDPDSLIGLIGTARSDIEKYDTGSVEFDKELWVARSENPIPAGSMVRIVFFDGLVLTVEKVEKLTKEKNYLKERSRMPFEQHQEKIYPKDAQSIYQAALKATEKLEGKVISSAPEKLRFEARFPKVILGKTLGERTQLSCEIRAQEGENCQVVVDAFPLDALERKLMFGARKGVTQTIVTWFTAHLEHNLGLA